MRTALLLTSASVIFLASCSSGNKMQSSVQGDDLYVAKTESSLSAPAETYTTDPSVKYQDEQTNPNPDYSTTDKYIDENGTNYITNNYYEGQNYDFYGNQNSYSSDLSHWYGPSLGFSYFSPFYSMGGFGASISFGFGWGSSWYNPYYYPYYSYNPWYSPYYYGYNPYYNPYYGYSGCGYYGGGYCGGGYYGGGYYGDGYGYGSGYGNNTYYGPHGSSSSNTSNDGDGRQYKYDGDVNGGLSNTSNGSGLNVTPASINVSNADGGIVSPVKTGGVIGVTDIKRNTTIQNNSPSGSGVIKNTTGRDLALPDNSDGIKTNVPATHSISPANVPVRQNNQENRPRTNSSALPPLLQQQQSSNAAINAANNRGTSHANFENQSFQTEKSALSVNDAAMQKSVINAMPDGRSKQNIIAQAPQKQKTLNYEKLFKSNQPSNLNIKADRSPTNTNNGNNAGRSYNQHSNSNAPSLGTNRSSNSSTHRK
ncbi:MAG: hypothetical protein IPO83_13555 [Chitinophagaceae bacterium]|nr:hypothetical protein [Chitinophagaceae bacterium]